jgi:hypothetical protein
MIQGSGVLRCDEPGCTAQERVPQSLAGEPEARTLKWLEGRAWASQDGRNLCPEHW